jgi:tetratricopeptide (TPR) repeat protein
MNVVTITAEYDHERIKKMSSEQQQAFKEALTMISSNDYEGALEKLKALNIDKDRADPRMLSYYGLCLARVESKLFEGIRLCREALTIERREPDIYYNLAQLYLISGKRTSAINLLYRGLPFEQKIGKSKKIITLIQEIVPRQKPFFKSLSRSHPLNKIIGKIKYFKSNRNREMVDKNIALQIK